MEENSEAHMDTGVSSTTDDILEIQEVTGSHSNEETLVVIETIDDEQVSPDANNAVLLTKSPSKTEPPKATKPPPQEMTVKKIIIKRDRKDFQIKTVQKSPSKSEDILKSPGKDSSPNKLVQSSITHKPAISVVDSSSKVENIKSPTNDTQKLIQSPSCNSSEAQKGSKISLVRDSQMRETTSTREPIVISPIKISIISPNKDHQSPNKEQGSKGVSTYEPAKALKEQSSKIQPPNAQIPKEQLQPPNTQTPKEQLPKVQPPKAQTPKEQSPKDQPPKAQIPKEQLPKAQTPKEQLPKAQTPTEQSPKAQTPNVQPLKVQSPKAQTLKEQSPKEQPTKEQLSKQSVKEQQSKTSPSNNQLEGPTSRKELTFKLVTSKESQTKTPGKESPIKPVEKEVPAKVSVIKETISRSSAKETPPPPPTESEKKSEDKSKAEEVLIKNKILSLLDDKEASNDSHIETCSESSEKEHKSISRELKSLINSAKESKIISECTQLTSKTRKSRTLDSANSSLNVSADAEKLQGVRRSSDNSQKSNCSEKSDKTAVKRSMRSQNPEFVNKVKNFLNSVSGKSLKVDADGSDDEVEEKPKEKEEKESTPVPKKKKIEEPAPPPLVVEKGNKLRIDPYCWRCHWATEPAENEKNPHPPVHCSVCPRSYHFKCLSGTERNKIDPEKNWVCPECMLILQAESSETRSPAMKKISLGMLCDLLKYALERMTQLNGVEPFMQPVDRTAFHDYDKYVVHPMDLGLMKQHIADGHYGSTEAFLADVQWILHNSIIFNTLQSKLTGVARALVRSCRVEMSEIEACPECYSAAHARKPTWFTDVCSTPHILLWAKLKGFPYWPAKGMSVNSSGHVDVRFFGAHDRAWVPARDCFLYSEKDPNNFRTKRQDILDSMQEAEQHIRNISRKYGKFVYPPFRTQFDPTKMNEQLKLMIPSFEGDVKNLVKDKSSNSPSGMLKDKSRSNSKSSKESFVDGDTSEGEETVRSRKMADGAVIAREEEDYSIDRDKEKEHKPMEVDLPKIKEKDSESSKKRRRSDLEEAVITIIDTSREKRKRVENSDKKDKETKDKEATTKTKENLPSTSSERSGSPKVAPIKLISISKVMKNSKLTGMTIVKDDDKNKTPELHKTKTKSEISSEKSDKEKSKDKEKDREKDKDTTEESKDRKHMRRCSKQRSSTHSDSSRNDKSSKKSDKPDKPSDTPGKEKSKDNSSQKVAAEIQNPGCSSTDNTKSAKDRIQFDDDMTLAVLARESRNAGHSGLPTISCVRSLSSASSSASAKSAQGAEASSDSSVLTPTSSEKDKNMNEAANKLQKLRSDTEPQVGRIGVRAFARTASPEKEKRPTNNTVEVEIKTEPMDFDDADRHMEKMDLMNAFKLRPVNPPSTLREVRINKVVVTPNQVINRKSTPTQTAPTQPQTIRPRAKKTFPQPKKPEENITRSELTSKNSMVYIPIQPPTTQAPVRGARPMSIAQSTPPTSRGHSTINAANNSLVNTVTSPLISSFSSPISSTSTNTNTTSTQGPTVGQVPTTVHTMPLITSVNGQWTFSLQPVLSVGGSDNTPSPPMVNGLSERAILPLAASAPVLVPAAAPIPAVPTTAAVNTPNRGSSDTSAPGEPPRLQQRPALVNPLDSSAPVGSVPPPSTVGPLTAKLNQNAVKMTDFFRQLLEDSIERLEEPTAQVTALKTQLEQYKWRHQQEINEIKHNHELTLTEMRTSFEKEKLRLVAETRRQTQLELDAAVKIAKSKQWCANCSQEAQFYCCWNTSYCDYPCQRAHWTQHYAVCTQQRSNDGNNDCANVAENRLQSPPENLPKTTAAPNLTVGGKQLAPSRVYTQEQQHQQKASIIVSMVDEGTGNPTMKCVGTYKQPTTAQMSPLIINKQIMSSEEAAKKVVTSGGYLIVGATNSPNTTTIPQARRTHAIQYIS